MKIFSAFPTTHFFRGAHAPSRALRGAPAAKKKTRANQIEQAFLDSVAFFAAGEGANRCTRGRVRSPIFGRTLKSTLAFAALGVFLLFGIARAEDAKPLYENNFESAEVGKVPDDFLVLDGGFTVKSDGTNKFLELPGAPLDSFGVLFGPTEKENIEVSARFNGTSKGRRFPTFAVGLNGQEGYKLQVSPAKKMLELYKADEVVASVGYEWKSGQWTMLKLAVRKAGNAWVVEGKAWTQGAKEPEHPTVSTDQRWQPAAGRASIWGQPYATTAIQFDDLLVKRVGDGK